MTSVGWSPVEAAMSEPRQHPAGGAELKEEGERVHDEVELAQELRQLSRAGIDVLDQELELKVDERSDEHRERERQGQISDVVRSSDDLPARALRSRLGERRVAVHPMLLEPHA
jgi:hypothetical protein